jgi:hypothetical protein
MEKKFEVTQEEYELLQKLKSVTKQNCSSQKKKGPITDRIKTLQDAIDEINPSQEVLTFIKTQFEDGRLRSSQAYVKLCIIIEALNEGWIPNWGDSNEYKYYPWFNMSSSGLSCYYYDDRLSYSYVGSRLCTKTADLAKYAANQFNDIYVEHMLIKD